MFSGIPKTERTYICEAKLKSTLPHISLQNKLFSLILVNRVWQALGNDTSIVSDQIIDFDLYKYDGGTNSIKDGSFDMFDAGSNKVSMIL